MERQKITSDSAYLVKKIITNFGFFVLLVLAGFWAKKVYPQTLQVYPAMTWSNSKDNAQYIFRQGSLMNCKINSEGYLEADKNASIAGEFISQAVVTPGNIKSVTLVYEAAGEVSLSVSTTGGSFYPVVCGQPFTPKQSGKIFQFKAKLAPGAVLKKVTVDCSDASGVVTGFGNPELSGFASRKAITIKNPSQNDIFNSPVKLMIEDSANKDFSDLRFTYPDAKTSLPYYLEKIEDVAGSRKAYVWIKPTQVPIDGLSVYFYYNNPAAESLSQGKDVFDLFDDFPSSNLDEKTWKIPATAKIAAKRLELSGEMVSQASYKAKNITVEYSASALAGGEIKVILRDASSGKNQEISAYSSNYSGTEHCLTVNDVVKINDPKPLIADKVYAYRLSIEGVNVVFTRFSQGFSQKEAEVTFKLDAPLDQAQVVLKNSGSSAVNFDWVRLSQGDFSSRLTVTAALEKENADTASFNGLYIDKKGNLILKDGFDIGNYRSISYELGFNAGIADISYQPINQLGLKASFSLDEGKTYRLNAQNKQVYYSGKDGFKSGKNLKYDLAFSRTNKVSPIASLVAVDYKAGAIKEVAIGRSETVKAKDKVKLTWSALNYGSDYPLTLKYSNDSGKTYELIADYVYNTGNYQWKVADKPGDKNLIEVCDSYNPDICGVTDKAFTIYR